MRRALACLARRLANQIAATPPEQPPSLTHMLMGAIHARAKARDEADPKAGGPSVQAMEVIISCAEVLGSLAVQGTEEDAERIITTAHAALDAAYRTQLTGVPSAISYGGTAQAVH